MALKLIGTDRRYRTPSAAPSTMALSIQRPAAFSWRTPAATVSRSSITTPGSIIATLPGFPEAAGVVADDGIVLVTNRGAASLAWVDAADVSKRAASSRPAPSPTALRSRLERSFAIAASIGEEAEGPKLHVISLDGRQQYSIDLPGAPRWCVTDADAERVFLAIREPSMVLVAQLPELTRCRALENAGRRRARA